MTRIPAATLLAASVLLVRGLASSAGSGIQEPPTFHSDIAPIVERSCAGCHRPGEAAPFPLLSYADVRKRARQIAQVTADRFMPPWLPSQEGVPLRGDRSLSDEEIETIQRWAAAGAPEGETRPEPDAGNRPVEPRPSNTWALGEPDLILELPEVYTLASEGLDVYRNFVIPTSLSDTRYVRAVEFRPLNRPVVHHAVLYIDRSGAARAADREDAEPGYAGMGPGPARLPDGIFVGWAPGKVPDLGSEDIAWKLAPGTDVVLQLHLRPSGKREPVQIQLGLVFADAPPALHPVAIRLMSRDIDLAPGASDVTVQDRYEIPVDLQILGVYPHAHYLGRECVATALKPDGQRQTLLRIPDWDFDWQDEYSFAEPLALPAGSVLEMSWTYDNSSDNPRNPSQPPARVRFGERSTDEMGELLLQVLPRGDDLALLWRDFAWKQQRDNLVYFERKAAEEPQNPQWHAARAHQLLRGRRVQEAIEAWRRVVELAPGKPGPLAQLGHALVASGAAAEALEVLRQATALEPSRAEARIDLARALELLGRSADARRDLEALLEKDPRNASARASLGEMLARAGETGAAATQFELAVASNPDHAQALWNLAQLRLEAGRKDEAIELYRRSLEIDPDEPRAHHGLGMALESRGELDQALRHYRLAHALEPADELFESELRRAEALRDSR